jgi:hypothetical protein
MKKTSILSVVVASILLLSGCSGFNQEQEVKDPFQQVETEESVNIKNEMIQVTKASIDKMLGGQLAETSSLLQYGMEAPLVSTKVYDYSIPFEQGIFFQSENKAYKMQDTTSFFIIVLNNILEIPMVDESNVRFSKDKVDGKDVYIFQEKREGGFIISWSATVENGVIIAGKYSESVESKYPEEETSLTYEIRYSLTDVEKAYITNGEKLAPAPDLAPDSSTLTEENPAESNE